MGRQSGMMEIIEPGNRKQSGCYVTLTKGFLMLILCMILCVGIGIIVHFAEQNLCDDKEEMTTAFTEDFTTVDDLPGTSSEMIPQTTPDTPALEPPKDHQLKPLKYLLEFEPVQFSTTSKTFRGFLELELLCLNQTAVLTLDSQGLKINKSSVFIRSSTDNRAIRFIMDEKENMIEFTLAGESFQPNNIYLISMNYTGNIMIGSSGIAARLDQNQTINVVFTNFEPTMAKMAFPCFDEPELKAVFQVTVVRKTHQISISNMELDRKSVRSDEMVADVYKPTPMMSTYLLAFVICDFKYLDAMSQTGIRVRAYYPEDFQKEAKQLIDFSVKVLDHFSNLFGIPYPLSKLDFFPVDNFIYAGMENWGLIIMSHKFMLFDPSKVSTSMITRYLTIITHEIVHQWIGNLVTVSDWQYIWMTEGLTEYLSLREISKIHPSFENSKNQLYVTRLKALNSKQRLISRPLSTSYFYQSAYRESASLFLMLDSILGEDHFDAAIKSFLMKFNQSNFSEDDLWDCMNLNASIDVKQFSKPWVTQKNYPLLTVTKNNSSTHLTLKQEPFQISSLFKKMFQEEEDITWTWPIPYSFMEYSKSHIHSSPIYNFEKKDSITISMNQSDWILANVNSYGFYRVNYDDQNWQNLAQQLKKNHQVISDVDRATLISDAWSLTRAKRIKAEHFLNLCDYLNKETSYIPWMAFTKIFDEFYQLSQQSEKMTLYLNFFQEKIKSIYEMIAWKNIESMSFEKRILQEAVVALACHLEYPHCISKAVQIYRKWKENPEQNSINPNYQFTVFCAGVKEGNRRDCEFLNERLGSGDSFEDTNIRMALTCANQPWILKSHLENILKSDSLSQKELTTIIAYIARNPIGTSIIKEFLESKCQIKDSISVGSGDMSVPCGTIAKSVSDLSGYDILQLQNTQYLSDSYLEHLLEVNFMKKSWISEGMVQGAKWLKKKINKTVVSNWRLPNDLKPFHYVIELKPDIYTEKEADFYSEGHVTIEIACLNSTQNIVLHSHMLNISNISVVVSSKPVAVLEVSYDDMNEMISLSLEEEIHQGSNLTLEIDFRGPLKNDLMGFYYSTYKKGQKSVYLATTQFEPTSARKAFPCFDEPQMKAKYDVILLRQPHYKSISNMPKKHSENRTGGYIADYFETTPIMSTYLLAFIVCDFERHTRTTANGTVVGVWTKSASVPHNELALNCSVKILDHYTQVFAEPYPLPKEDLIAIPDFAAGAMENWGLITYREVALLYDSNYTSIKQEQYVVLVVAHELAHQWFGNLVTMCWWNDLWLNEGFATFVEYIGMDHYNPKWKIFDYFAVHIVQRALEADGSLSSHPLDVPSGHSIAFDDISYRKGASVIRMMEFFLGDSIFTKGLQRYIKKHMYSNAANKDLWEAFTEEAIAQNKSNLNVADIMKEWILEMNYPVIFVKWNGSNVVISQRRFLFERNSYNCKKLNNVIWKVPFTFATRNDLNMEKTFEDIQWLFGIEKTITVNQSKGKNDWILGNVHQKGFYRVNYEKENWKKLIQQLKTNHQKIPAANRAQIIDDAWSLAEAEMLDDYIPLEILDYLQYERDDVPMVAAHKQVMYVKTMLYEKADYGCFKEYMQQIIKKPFDDVKDLNNTLFQSTVFSLACRFGLSDCINLALNLFSEWKNAIKNNSSSSPLTNIDILSTVFCIGVEFGNKDDWFTVYTAFLKTNDAAERKRFIYALGCTRKLWLLQTFLKAAIEMKDFRRQDFRDVASAISKNPTGNNLLWQYIQNNWDELVDEHGQRFLLPSMIKAATLSFNSEYQLEELKNFMDTHPILGVGKESFENALDRTRINIRWMNRNERVIKIWLFNQNLKKKACDYLSVH